jgi:hypothetical protein
MKIIKTPKSLQLLHQLAQSAFDKRKQADILVIDDKGFSYKELLNQHHFHVTHWTDIEDVRAVRDYPIILCDIKGVGAKFGSKYEGAYVIEEIKKHFPHKVLIGYSTYSLEPSFNKFLRYCDEVVEKDLAFEGWVTILDRATELVVDPVLQWKRVRDDLLRRDVPLFTVFQIEQIYIDSILAKNPDLLIESSLFPKLNPDVRAVIHGFTGNLIFKLIGV